MTASPDQPLSVGPFPPRRHVHLIGIAGSGMRNLAKVLRARQWSISGSDLAPSAFASGIFRGHCAENVTEETDLVIASDAVPEENCERARARRLGLPVVSYAQMLGRLMAEGRGLAVAGTHGKSTAAAMAATILIEAGLDPTVVIGAEPVNKAGGSRAGRGDLVLVEACEYRANFLHLRPWASLILGIEPDHFDCYANREELTAAFAAFARQIAPGGIVIAAADCPATRVATATLACRVETFGWGSAADWQAGEPTHIEGRFQFRLLCRGHNFGCIRLQVPGRHNVLNALAAAALACAAGAGPEAICRGLAQFRGVKRRLQELGSIGPARWLDDYAHHPTQITAAIETARLLAPGRRVWCIFQPHQASRTAALLEALAVSLSQADKTYLAAIYRAREGQPLPGEPTAADLALALRRLGGEVELAPGRPQQTAARVGGAIARGELTRGDIIITMGAGDIWKAGHELSQRFRKHCAAG